MGRSPFFKKVPSCRSSSGCTTKVPGVLQNRSLNLNECKEKTKSDKTIDECLEA